MKSIVRSLFFASSLLCAVIMAVPASSTAATISSIGGVQVIVDEPDAALKPAPRAKVHRAAAHAATHARALPSNTVAASTRAAALIRYAMNFVGVPYVWGGTSPSGFDCSGFTYYTYAAVGVAIPRTADLQFAVGRPIAGYPEPGDLVFFQTYEVGASHVGIYLGNGWFIQAIRPDVHLSNFNSSYFRSRYLGARRLLPA